MKYRKNPSVDVALSAHLAAIGARGGSVVSARKLAALQELRERKSKKVSVRKALEKPSIYDEVKEG